MSELNDSIKTNINAIKKLFSNPEAAAKFFGLVIKSTDLTDGQINYLKDTIAADEEFKETLNNWFSHEGDKFHRLEYKLDENSVIFDVGGYLGTWSSFMFCRYRSKIFIFEPVKKFCETIAHQFKYNPDVKLFEFGLSNKNEFIEISLLDDSSSEFKKNAEANETVLVRDASEFLSEIKIDKIDLMKINIEGGEYSLLNNLIDSGKIKNIKDIQVQFHNFYLDANTQRNAIREKLSETHVETYCFPFVWENWRLKEPN